MFNFIFLMLMNSKNEGIFAIGKVKVIKRKMKQGVLKKHKFKKKIR